MYFCFASCQEMARIVAFVSQLFLAPRERKLGVWWYMRIPIVEKYLVNPAGKKYALIRSNHVLQIKSEQTFYDELTTEFTVNLSEAISQFVLIAGRISDHQHFSSTLDLCDGFRNDLVRFARPCAGYAEYVRQSPVPHQGMADT